MYTTNCPNCNFEVSNQQTVCPRCGMALTSNAPVGQPQNYQGQTGNQMQYAPAGPPGTAPATAGGAGNKNAGDGKLRLILIAIVGIIAIAALAFAVIGVLPGAAEVEPEEDDDDHIRLKDFSIENFVVTSDITEYADRDDYVWWEGTGDITVSDKKSVFLVSIRITLVSGGNEETVKESTHNIVVDNGLGKIYRSAAGNLTDTPEPVYDIELLGFTRFSK